MERVVIFVDRINIGKDETAVVFPGRCNAAFDSLRQVGIVGIENGDVLSSRKTDALIDGGMSAPIFAGLELQRNAFWRGSRFEKLY
jgi:hypothetical protein